MRPQRPATGYAPNSALEITPQFLELTLDVVRREGFEVVSLGEARRRLVESQGAPFAALTFDDGYRDTLIEALPVLERHSAPFTVYCAIGFIERTARLWWLELEEAVRRLETIDIAAARIPARTPAEKSAAFERIYWLLRGRQEPELLETVGDLARRAGVDCEALSEGLFMDWSEMIGLSRHPLATIGAHSVTHRRLAHWSADETRAEMANSKASLEARLGIEVDSFAYPFGDPASAGAREFELARKLGFATAVTMRPGMLFPEHVRRLTELPRVSVNGRWQRPKRWKCCSAARRSGCGTAAGGLRRRECRSLDRLSEALAALEEDSHGDAAPISRLRLAIRFPAIPARHPIGSTRMVADERFSRRLCHLCGLGSIR